MSTSARFVHHGVGLFCFFLGGALLNASEGLEIEYALDRSGQVSSAIYDSDGRMVRTLLCGEPLESGMHRLVWDGLDRDGRPAARGTYTYKVLCTPGFRAEYVTSLGINPASAPYHRWVGNHGGAASVAVDSTGVYIAAQITETAPVLLKQSADGKQRFWTRSRGEVTEGRYQGGISLASDGNGRLYMLQQNGYLQVIDAEKGELEHTWDVLPENLPRKSDDAPPWLNYHHGEKIAGADMEALGDTIVISFRDRNQVRWISGKDGTVEATVELPSPTGLTIDASGDVFVASLDRIYVLSKEGKREVVVQRRLDSPCRLAIDPVTGDLLVAERAPSHQVKRFSTDGRLLATYGRHGGRREGVYRAADFRGITDIADDGRGGFYVVELQPAPRRVVHCDPNGTPMAQWFGGQPYYAWGEPDPRDPSRVWFNSGDWLVLVEIDVASGKWRVAQTWNVDALAEGLVDSRPGHHGRWWVLYRGNQRYLVSEGAPQVLRHAPGRLEPLSVVGHVAQSPKAAEMAVESPDAKTFRWLDQNRDGKPQSKEFRFSAGDDLPKSQWVTPDFAVLQTGSVTTYEQARLRLWKTLPRWKDGLPAYPIGDESGLKQSVASKPVTASFGSRGSGAYEDAHGNFFANYNGGCQRHGDSWPTYWGGRSRLVKWDAQGSLRWSVGRHAVHGGLGDDAGTTPPGRLHVPINAIGEANDTVILADRVETLAMAWTQDGLYAGAFFDHRTEDGLPETVYHWWRTPEGVEAITTSDNAQGGRVFECDDGTVLWFVQGRNSVPVYKIHGWEGWQRREGVVQLESPAPTADRQGSGLQAEYFTASKIDGRPKAVRREQQIWHGIPRGNEGSDAVVDGFHFGPIYDWSERAEPLERKTNFAVRWTGQIEAPLSEAFTFSTYARGGVRLWVDRVQRIFAWNETTTRWESDPIPLIAGRRYDVQLDFYTTHPHPACSLNWESFSLDRERIPEEFLYPETDRDASMSLQPRPATGWVDARGYDLQSGEIDEGHVREGVGGLRQRGFGRTGAYLGFRKLKFDQGLSKLVVRGSGRPAGDADFNVELAFRLESPEGRTIATVSLSGESLSEAPLTVQASSLSGVHDVYIVNTTPEKWHFVTLERFRFQ